MTKPTREASSRPRRRTRATSIDRRAVALAAAAVALSSSGGAAAGHPRRTRPDATARLQVTTPAARQFTQAPGYPPGVTFSLLRGLEGGGAELYLRVPAGGTIPRHWNGADASVVVLRGHAVSVTADGRFDETPGTFVYEPAGAVQRLDCLPGEDCLAYIRTGGPHDPHDLP